MTTQPIFTNRILAFGLGIAFASTPVFAFAAPAVMVDTNTSAHTSVTTTTHSGIKHHTKKHLGSDNEKKTPRTHKRTMTHSATSTKEKMEKVGDSTTDMHGATTAHASTTITTTGGTSMEDNNPIGAVAVCTDGLYSHNPTHERACSGHGGVKQFLK